MELNQIQDVIRAVFGEVVFAGDLSKLIAMQPNRYDNPVGTAVANAIINRAKGALPGEIRERTLGTDDLGYYRNLFYPGYCYNDPNEALVAINDNIWEPLSVAVLSQTIYYTSNDTRRSLVIEDIERDVSYLNNMILSHLWSWYARILPNVMPKFRDLVNSLGGAIEARNKYRQILLSDNWAQMINEQIRGGQLTDLEWFFYHHWVKLTSLEFSLSDIGNLIETMIPKLIEMPQTVRSHVWGYYRAWYTLDNINYRLFPETQSRILKSTYEVITTPSGYTNWVEHKETYSLLFCTGPGKKYYSPPSSCFAAGTKVRMADGSLCPIENVQVGDELATPNGVRRVLIAADVPRADRPLFSLSGCMARFTDLHPFRCASGPDSPRNACVDPRRAGMVLPTLQRLGMGRLTNGIKLLTYSPGGPQAVVIEGCARHDPDLPGGNDELVYDLILEPDETGFPDYFAGDDNRQFLVSAEIPVFVESPLTTQVVLSALSAIRQPLSQISTTVNIDSEQEQFLIANSLFTKLISIATRRVAVQTEEFELPDKQQSLSGFVAGHLDLFGAPDDLKSYNRFSVWLLEHLMANHGEELESFLEMGWRLFPQPANTAAEVIAVSLLSVNFDVAAAIPINQHLQVSLSCSVSEQTTQDWQTLNEDGTAANSCFSRYFHDVAYFDLNPAGKENEGTMGIEFRIEGTQGSDFESFSAVGRVIWPPTEGYRHANALVYRADGTDCGVLYFDVRILARADVERERAARHSWTEEKQLRFALAFGQELGAELKNRF